MAKHGKAWQSMAKQKVHLSQRLSLLPKQQGRLKINHRDGAEAGSLCGGFVCFEVACFNLAVGLHLAAASPPPPIMASIGINRLTNKPQDASSSSSFSVRYQPTV
jgi:hypothetical protein